MRKDPKILKIISLVTCLCFLGEQALFADMPQVIQSAFSSSEVRSLETFRQFDLPAELGQVEEIWIPEGKRVPAKPLILIQDAHGHHGAQEQIQKLLTTLQQELGNPLLLLEGGFGELDAGWLNFFEDDNANREAARFLEAQAEIGGPELFLFENNKTESLRAFGVEDPELYASNVKAYRAAVQLAGDSGPEMERALARIQSTASATLNEDLLQLFKTWVRFEKEETGLTHYLNTLEQAAAGTLKIDLNHARAQRAWPMLVRLKVLEAYAEERDDVLAGQQQQDLFLWAMEKGMSRVLIETLSALPAEPGPAFRDLRHFWEAFYAEAGSEGFRFADYPQLTLREGLRILEKEMDALDLFAEIDRLRDRVLTTLAGSEHEKALITAFKQWLLIRKLLRLELTRDDYRSVSKGEIETSAALKPAVAEALNFYKSALARDEVITQSISEHLQSTGSDYGVLITGGFHRKGITARLHNLRIPYAVVTPRIAEIESHDAYRNAMLQKKPQTRILGATSRWAQFLQPQSDWVRYEVAIDRRLALVDEIARNGRERGLAITPHWRAERGRIAKARRVDSRNELRIEDGALLEKLDLTRDGVQTSLAGNPQFFFDQYRAYAGFGKRSVSMVDFAEGIGARDWLRAHIIATFKASHGLIKLTTERLGVADNMLTLHMGPALKINFDRIKAPAGTMLTHWAEAEGITTRALRKRLLQHMTEAHPRTGIAWDIYQLRKDLFEAVPELATYKLTLANVLWGLNFHKEFFPEFITRKGQFAQNATALGESIGMVLRNAQPVLTRLEEDLLQLAPSLAKTAAPSATEAGEPYLGKSIGIATPAAMTAYLASPEIDWNFETFLEEHGDEFGWVLKKGGYPELVKRLQIETVTRRVMIARYRVYSGKLVAAAESMGLLRKRFVELATSLELNFDDVAVPPGTLLARLFPHLDDDGRAANARALLLPETGLDLVDLKKRIDERADWFSPKSYSYAEVIWGLNMVSRFETNLEAAREQSKGRPNTLARAVGLNSAAVLESMEKELAELKARWSAVAEEETAPEPAGTPAVVVIKKRPPRVTEVRRSPLPSTSVAEEAPAAEEVEMFAGDEELGLQPGRAREGHRWTMTGTLYYPDFTSERGGKLEDVITEVHVAETKRPARLAFVLKRLADAVELEDEDAINTWQYRLPDGAIFPFIEVVEFARNDAAFRADVVEYLNLLAEETLTREELRVGATVLERKQKVVELVDRGIAGTAVFLGYHGTSVEAIQQMIETGYLPSGGRHPGRLYFFPLDGPFDHQDAANYATWNAIKFYVGERLPFEMTTERWEQLSAFVTDHSVGHAGDPFYAGLLETLDEHGVGEQGLIDLIEEAEDADRQGFVIILSNEIQEKLNVVYHSDPNYEADYIEIPEEGLPIDQILGIEELGDFEFEYIEQLRAELQTTGDDQTGRFELRAMGEPTETVTVQRSTSQDLTRNHISIRTREGRDFEAVRLSFGHGHMRTFLEDILGRHSDWYESGHTRAYFVFENVTSSLELEKHHYMIEPIGIVVFNTQHRIQIPLMENMAPDGVVDSSAMTAPSDQDWKDVMHMMGNLPEARQGDFFYAFDRKPIRTHPVRYNSVQIASDGPVTINYYPRLRVRADGDRREVIFDSSFHLGRYRHDDFDDVGHLQMRVGHRLWSAPFHTMPMPNHIAISEQKLLIPEGRDWNKNRFLRGIAHYFRQAFARAGLPDYAVDHNWLFWQTRVLFTPDMIEIRQYGENERFVYRDNYRTGGEQAWFQDTPAHDDQNLIQAGRNLAHLAYVMSQVPGDPNVDWHFEGYDFTRLVHEWLGVPPPGALEELRVDPDTLLAATDISWGQIGMAAGAAAAYGAASVMLYHAWRRRRIVRSTDRILFNTNLNELDYEKALVLRHQKGVTPDLIEDAAQLLTAYGVVPEPTPTVEKDKINAFMSQMLGRPVRMIFKDETRNHTGSFKDRGPVEVLHRVEQYLKGSELTLPEEVLTMSTGNQGAAVVNMVRAAIEAEPRLEGEILGRVFMDINALGNKKANIRHLGGEVVDRYEDGTPILSYKASEDEVLRLVDEAPERRIYIPHADKYVLAGYATAAVEALEQLETTHGISLDDLKPGELAVLTSFGSGGWFSAWLETAARLREKVVTYGVSGNLANMTLQSHKEGRILKYAVPFSSRLVTDGNLATPADFSFDLTSSLANGLLQVTETDALYATALLQANGIFAEGTSGLALAAVLLNPDLFENTNTFLVPLSSRNRGEAISRRIDPISRQPELITRYFAKRRRQLESIGRSGFDTPRLEARRDPERSLRLAFGFSAAVFAFSLVHLLFANQVVLEDAIIAGGSALAMVGSVLLYRAHLRQELAQKTRDLQMMTQGKILRASRILEEAMGGLQRESEFDDLWEYEKDTGVAMMVSDHLYDLLTEDPEEEIIADPRTGTPLVLIAPRENSITFNAEVMARASDESTALLLYVSLTRLRLENDPLFQMHPMDWSKTYMDVFITLSDQEITEHTMTVLAAGRSIYDLLLEESEFPEGLREESGLLFGHSWTEVLDRLGYDASLLDDWDGRQELRRPHVAEIPVVDHKGQRDELRSTVIEGMERNPIVTMQTRRPLPDYFSEPFDEAAENGRMLDFLVAEHRFNDKQTEKLRQRLIKRVFPLLPPQIWRHRGLPFLHYAFEFEPFVKYGNFSSVYRLTYPLNGESLDVAVNVPAGLGFANETVGRDFQIQDYYAGIGRASFHPRPLNASVNHRKTKVPVNDRLLIPFNREMFRVNPERARLLARNIGQAATEEQKIKKKEDLNLAVYEYLADAHEVHWTAHKNGLLPLVWEVDVPNFDSKMVALGPEEGLALMRNFTGMLTYFYEPGVEDGRTLTNVQPNAGDVVYRHKDGGQPESFLITMRDWREGVSVPEFIDGLIHLYAFDEYTEAEPGDGLVTVHYDKTGTDPRLPVSNPAIAFHGLRHGLMNLHGSKKGETLTDLWLQLYLQDEISRPYRADARAFRAGKLPLDTDYSQRGFSPREELRSADPDVLLLERAGLSERQAVNEGILRNPITAKQDRRTLPDFFSAPLTDDPNEHAPIMDFLVNENSFDEAQIDAVLQDMTERVFPFLPPGLAPGRGLAEGAYDYHSESFNKVGNFNAVYRLTYPLADGPLDVAVNVPSGLGFANETVGRDFRIRSYYAGTGRTRFHPAPLYSTVVEFEHSVPVGNHLLVPFWQQMVETNKERAHALNHVLYWIPPGRVTTDRRQDLNVAVFEYLRNAHEVHWTAHKNGTLPLVWKTNGEGTRSQMIALDPEEGLDLMKQFTGLLTYFYEPQVNGGRTLTNVMPTAGDLVYRDTEDGKGEGYLITMRDWREGVSIPEFIDGLIHLHAFDEQTEHEPGDGSVTILSGTDGMENELPISNPAIAFHGLRDGLIALHGAERGDELARRWLLQYLDDGLSRPYRNDVRAFLSDSLPLDTDYSQRGFVANDSLALAELRSASEAAFYEAPSLKTYVALSDAERNQIRGRFKRAFAKSLRLGSMVQGDVRTYSIDDHFHDLVEAAKTARRKFGRIDAEAKVVALGSSPEWLVRAVELIDQASRKQRREFVYLPFSNRSKADFELLPAAAKRVKAYAQLVDHAGHHPFDHRGRTIVVEYSTGFRSVLRFEDVLDELVIGRRTGIVVDPDEERMLDYVHFYMLTEQSEQEFVDLWNNTAWSLSWYDVNAQAIDADLLQTLSESEHHFKDRITPYFPPGEWTKASLPAAKPSRRAAHKYFGLIEYMAAKGTIKLPKRAREELRAGSADDELLEADLTDRGKRWMDEAPLPLNYDQVRAMSYRDHIDAQQGTTDKSGEGSEVRFLVSMGIASAATHLIPVLRPVSPFGDLLFGIALGSIIAAFLYDAAVAAAFAYAQKRQVRKTGEALYENLRLQKFPPRVTSARVRGEFAEPLWAGALVNAVGGLATLTFGALTLGLYALAIYPLEPPLFASLLTVATGIVPLVLGLTNLRLLPWLSEDVPGDRLWKALKARYLHKMIEARYEIGDILGVEFKRGYWYEDQSLTFTEASDLIGLDASHTILTTSGAYRVEQLAKPEHASSARSFVYEVRGALSDGPAIPYEVRGYPVAPRTGTYRFQDRQGNNFALYKLDLPEELERRAYDLARAELRPEELLPLAQMEGVWAGLGLLAFIAGWVGLALIAYFGLNYFFGKATRAKHLAAFSKKAQAIKGDAEQVEQRYAKARAETIKNLRKELGKKIIFAEWLVNRSMARIQKKQTGHWPKGLEPLPIRVAKSPKAWVAFGITAAGAGAYYLMQTRPDLVTDPPEEVRLGALIIGGVILAAAVIFAVWKWSGAVVRGIWNSGPVSWVRDTVHGAISGMTYSVTKFIGDIYYAWLPAIGRAIASFFTVFIPNVFRFLLTSRRLHVGLLATAGIAGLAAAIYFTPWQAVGDTGSQAISVVVDTGTSLLSAAGSFLYTNRYVFASAAGALAAAALVVWTGRRIPGWIRAARAANWHTPLVNISTGISRSLQPVRALLREWISPEDIRDMIWLVTLPVMLLIRLPFYIARIPEGLQNLRAWWAGLPAEARRFRERLAGYLPVISRAIRNVRETGYIVPPPPATPYEGPSRSVRYPRREWVAERTNHYMLNGEVLTRLADGYRDDILVAADDENGLVEVTRPEQVITTVLGDTAEAEDLLRRLNEDPLLEPYRNALYHAFDGRDIRDHYVTTASGRRWRRSGFVFEDFVSFYDQDYYFSHDFIRQLTGRRLFFTRLKVFLVVLLHPLWYPLYSAYWDLYSWRHERRRAREKAAEEAAAPAEPADATQPPAPAETAEPVEAPAEQADAQPEPRSAAEYFDDLMEQFGRTLKAKLSAAERQLGGESANAELAELLITEIETHLRTITENEIQRLEMGEEEAQAFREIASLLIAPLWTRYEALLEAQEIKASEDAELEAARVAKRKEIETQFAALQTDIDAKIETYDDPEGPKQEPAAISLHEVITDEASPLDDLEKKKRAGWLQRYLSEKKNDVRQRLAREERARAAAPPEPDPEPAPVVKPPAPTKPASPSLRQTPERVEPPRNETDLQMARRFVRERNREEAEEIFRSIMANTSRGSYDRTSVYSGMVQMLIKRGPSYLPEALALAEEGLEIMPENVWLQGQRAWILFFMAQNAHRDGNLETAEARLIESHAQAEGLLALDGNNTVGLRVMVAVLELFPQVVELDDEGAADIAKQLRHVQHRRDQVERISKRDRKQKPREELRGDAQVVPGTLRDGTTKGAWHLSNNIRLTVALNLTFSIAQLDDAIIEQILALHAAEDKPVEELTEHERARTVANYVRLFRQGGHAVLPAAIVNKLVEEQREDYFELIFEAAERAEFDILPTLHFAGHGAGDLKSELFTYDLFKQNPSAARMFVVELLEEALISARLKNKPVSVSTMDIEQNFETNIPSFFLPAEEIDNLTDVERFRYLNQMTQLQLLAAVELKDELAKAATAEDVTRIVGGFLQDVGIAFDSEDGLFKPSVSDMLSDSLSTYLENRLAVAVAA